MRSNTFFIMKHFTPEGHIAKKNVNKHPNLNCLTYPCCFEVLPGLQKLEKLKISRVSKEIKRFLKEEPGSGVSAFALKEINMLCIFYPWDDYEQRKNRKTESIFYSAVFYLTIIYWSNLGSNVFFIRKFHNQNDEQVSAGADLGFSWGEGRIFKKTSKILLTFFLIGSNRFSELSHITIKTLLRIKCMGRRQVFLKKKTGQKRHF